MGKGRKAIPDELKVLRGTDQPCRLTGEAVKADKIGSIGQITSTRSMKLLPTRRSKEIFKQKANQLIALGVLTELDLEMLAVYANSLDVLFMCLDGMRKPAVPKYNEDGDLIGYVPNPAVKMYKQMVDDVNRIGSEFGFTPISRQRINQTDRETGDPFKDLLKDA